jgi:hypothetical protein
VRPAPDPVAPIATYALEPLCVVSRDTVDMPHGAVTGRIALSPTVGPGTGLPV